MRYKFAVLLGLTLSLSAATGSAHADQSPGAAEQTIKTVVPIEHESHKTEPRDFEFAYIDKSGKIAITGPFAMAHSFSKGVAVVEEKPYEWHDEHWTAPTAGRHRLGNTIIDTKDKIVNKIGLVGIEPFRDQHTVAQVRKTPGSSYVLVDTHGGTIPIEECRQATNYSEGLFAIEKDLKGDTTEEKPGRFGYMDKGGKMVIPGKFAAAGPFCDGLAAVGRQRTTASAAKPGQKSRTLVFYYIDKSGKEVVPGPFEDAQNFQDDVAGVCRDNKWGFIDEKGKEVIPFEYDWVGEFSSSLAPAEKDGKVGYINKSGKVVIPFKFKHAESFGEDLAPATTDGELWGFIDRNGDFKIEPTFKRAYTFSDGLALVHIKPRTDIGTHPEEAEYFYKTANQLREDGALNDAVRYCDTVIKVAPQSDWAKQATNLKLVALPDHFIKQELLDLLMVGTLNAERHEYDTAAKKFKDCLDQDPGFVQASGSLAYALISQKKFDEAEPVLKATLAKYPNYARGYFRLAQVYEGQGKLTEAQTTLDKAKTLAPDDLLFQVYELQQTSR